MILIVKLTAFADEISPDLNEQLNVLETIGIRYLELRSVWNKNVLELTELELISIKNILESRNFLVSSIGSPIGKINIEDDFNEHLIKFKRAIDIAKLFKTKYIRVFSFFISKEINPLNFREEVIYRIKEMTNLASKFGIIVLHENEKGIYGDSAERCLDIFSSCNNPYLKCIIDPANFVQCGIKPYSEAFPLLDPYIEYVHIKDALFKNNEIVPVGQGDGEISELLKSLFNRGFNGFLSLEPHLKSFSTFKGFSGKELFIEAADSLFSLINDTYYKLNLEHL